jgi:acyl-CoA thioester hydrolase
MSRHCAPANPGHASAPFSWAIRVYWEDTDAGGVVYHASYLRFLERARSEWLRGRGIEQPRMREQDGAVLVVRSMQLDFRRSARLDDELAVTVTLTDCRAASLVLAQRIERGGELLLEAQVRVACVAAADFTPIPLPERLRAALTGADA